MGMRSDADFDSPSNTYVPFIAVLCLDSHCAQCELSINKKNTLNIQ